MQVRGAIAQGRHSVLQPHHSRALLSICLGSCDLASAISIASAKLALHPRVWPACHRFTHEVQCSTQPKWHVATMMVAAPALPTWHTHTQCEEQGNAGATHCHHGSPSSAHDADGSSQMQTMSNNGQNRPRADCANLLTIILLPVMQPSATPKLACKIHQVCTGCATNNMTERKQQQTERM